MSRRQVITAMPVLTQEQLDHIKSVLEASNAEGWTVEEDERCWELYAEAPVLQEMGGIKFSGHPLKLLKCSKDYETYYPDPPDTRFIVNSGRYVRDLLDTIDELTKKTSQTP